MGVQSMGTPELLKNAFKAEGDTVNSWLAEADYKTVMHMLVQHRNGLPREWSQHRVCLRSRSVWTALRHMV